MFPYLDLHTSHIHCLKGEETPRARVTCFSHVRACHCPGALPHTPVLMPPHTRCQRKLYPDLQPGQLPDACRRLRTALNAHLVLPEAGARCCPPSSQPGSAASPAPGTAGHLPNNSARYRHLHPTLPPWPLGASTPNPAGSQSPWEPLTSPLPRVTPEQPPSFPDSLPVATSTRGPSVPLLPSSFYEHPWPQHSSAIPILLPLSTPHHGP